MNNIEIDVIIPVFNGERYIQYAIHSVQKQTLSAARIIVADDGSTDKTAEVVTSFMSSDPRITYLNLAHEGVSSTRNAGIRASKAPFVAFLDADDIWLPEKLERQAEVFSNSTEQVGFVHSSYFLIDSEGDRLPDQRVVSPKKRGDVFKPLLFDGYVLSGSASSVVVRRALLDVVGYFDVRLFHGEDWDLWIRLAQASEVDFTSEPVVGIRVHSESAQRRAKPDRATQFFQQQILVYEKWRDVIAGDKLFRKSLRRRAVEAVLPVVRHPQQAHDFYISLTKSESPVVRSVFRNSFHFWCEVSFGVLGILWRRVKRKAGLHVRKK
ncbi:glycosyltransferase [Agrobacterium sp.]|jgi:glycosyltransferase involved in cell wall biosynthesis|uniref:glycosyltransferase n=1 Tax=Agrobacterium sp. TaxID=361 RepID=UPI0028A6E4DB